MLGFGCQGVYYTNVEQQCWLANKCIYKMYPCNQIHIIFQSIWWSSKMAMWLKLQHHWPWPIAIYQAINTRETKYYFATLAIFSRITNIDQSSRPRELWKVSCKCNIALEQYHTWVRDSMVDQLSNIVMYNQLQVEQKWFLFRQAH